MRVIDSTEPDGRFAQGRPLPLPDNVSREFWAAASRGDLVVQQCGSCGHLQFYPRALCTACGATPGWLAVSGEGTVYTFTVIRQNLAPPFDVLGPYAVAMIKLTEGPMMMGNITGIDPAEVTIGTPVRAYAVRVEEDLAIPFWEPV